MILLVSATAFAKTGVLCAPESGECRWSSQEVASDVVSGFNLFESRVSAVWQFRVGERAFNVERDSALVTVVGIQADGRYVLRFEDGPLRGRTGGNWLPSSLAKIRGCSARFCVGDLAYNVDRDSALVRVVGIQVNGLHVVDYLDGQLAGRRGGNWRSTNLAANHGCSRYFCVGDHAINVERNYARVRIVGIQEDHRHVIEYLDGTLRGRRGGNWSYQNLARGR